MSLNDYREAVRLLLGMEPQAFTECHPIVDECYHRNWPVRIALQHLADRLLLNQRERLNG